MKNDLKSQWARTWQAATPIVGIETTDSWQTIRTIASTKPVDTSTGQALSIIEWDTVRGATPDNNEAGMYLPRLLDGQEPNTLVRLDDFLRIIIKAENCIIFVHNAMAFMTGPDRVLAIQGISNLRDYFKGNGSTLVLLSPVISLPIELQQDITVIDDPLPTEEELQEIVKSTCEDSIKRSKVPNQPIETMADIPRVAGMLAGLNAFGAEQTLSISIGKSENGGRLVDIDVLTDRVRREIEAAKGLTVDRSDETLDTIRGCDNAVKYCKRVLDKGNYRMILLIDEIEKHLAGMEGDNTGVSQDMVGAYLTWSEDNKIPGMIFVGVNGSGKTAIPKGLAKYAGIPLVSMDLGGMKESLVGASGNNIRMALKRIMAMSKGRVLVVATCNRIAVLPPELRRRFKLGTFFFDSLSSEARALLWPVYTKYYGLAKQLRTFSDDQWTGAEVRACCERARDLDITLDESAKYIVPTAISAREQIEALRNAAVGKFLNAAKEGVYMRQVEAEVKGRQFKLD